LGCAIGALEGGPVRMIREQTAEFGSKPLATLIGGGRTAPDRATGGFIEYVLTQGPDAVDEYVRACREVGFDIIEISGGFISIATDDWLRLVEKVQKAGLKAKPEVGIKIGAGGDTDARELQAEGTRDPEWMISQARRFIDAGPT
jgi:phosphosulfolactate synthase (CoM biosynthesis protein A)